ncbi:MAG: hypothetical protein KDG52_15560 [Rhodocyclaceae bacterium]|nr:hypothetical protein [Rhodocyclaceae bacterium]
MYEQFLKTWQTPQQTGLWADPWQALERAVQQSVAMQSQWAEQFADLFGANDAARQVTRGMVQRAGQLYLASVESQIGWWRTLAALWAPAAGMAQASAWMQTPAARSATAQGNQAAVKLEVVDRAPVPVVVGETPAPADRVVKDDLKQISGIGPGLEKKLNAEGIVSFRQIAGLTEDDIARLEQTVIKFPGRIERDGWVEQARKLAAAQ